MQGTAQWRQCNQWFAVQSRGYSLAWLQAVYARELNPRPLATIHGVCAVAFRRSHPGRWMDQQLRRHSVLRLASCPRDDIHTALLVSLDGLEQEVVKSAVLNRQVAPTNFQLISVIRSGLLDPRSIRTHTFRAWSVFGSLPVAPARAAFIPPQIANPQSSQRCRTRSNTTRWPARLANRPYRFHERE